MSGGPVSSPIHHDVVRYFTDTASAVTGAGFRPPRFNDCSGWIAAEICHLAAIDGEVSDECIGPGAIGLGFQDLGDALWFFIHNRNT